MLKAEGLEYESIGEGEPVLLIHGSHIADAFLLFQPAVPPNPEGRRAWTQPSATDAQPEDRRGTNRRLSRASTPTTVTAAANQALAPHGTDLLANRGKSIPSGEVSSRVDSSQDVRQNRLHLANLDIPVALR